jgi:hypothetical protein
MKTPPRTVSGLLAVLAIVGCVAGCAKHSTAAPDPLGSELRADASSLAAEAATLPPPAASSPTVPAQSGAAAGQQTRPNFAGTIHAKDQQGYTFDVSFDVSSIGPVARSVIDEPPGKYAALMAVSGTFQVRSTTMDRNTPADEALSITIDALYPVGNAACENAVNWTGDQFTYTLTSPSGTFCDRNLSFSGLAVPALLPGQSTEVQQWAGFAQGLNANDQWGYPPDVAIYRDIDASEFTPLAAALPNPAIYVATIGYGGSIFDSAANPPGCVAVEPPHDGAEFDASKPTISC